MKIQLTTSGGLTGRGVGSVKIEGASVTVDDRVTVDLTDAEEARLHRLPILRNTRGPAATADAVTYTLTVDGQRWSWSDLGATREFATWAEALLAIRERALGQTSSSSM